MQHQYSTKQALLISLLSLVLTSCYFPPYNNFKPYFSRPSVVKKTAKRTTAGLIIGTTAAAIAGAPVLVGTAIGGLTGVALSARLNSRQEFLKELQRQNIQYIEYGDRITLIVPVDHYFVFNTAQLNEVCYPGLANIVKLIKSFPCGPVYVAAFTDEIGSSMNKRKLSQAQAEAMATYLWANGISAQCLFPEGYGDKNPVSDNALIHGSAQNRRIEIQWFKNPVTCTFCRC